MIDFKDRDFDALEPNRYEIVIASSKLARKINDRIRQNPEVEENVRPTSAALNFILDSEVQFIYEEDKKDNKV